tara:strand:- start:2204 stop:2644 length:441 start_codon:yes stop_codon:yes gene_type:complete
MKNFLLIIVLCFFYTTMSFADFSPDGSKIVFSSNMSGRDHIFISDSDGSNTKRISREAGSYFNPVWSPLGDLIAFEKIENDQAYIGVMEIDGSNERMLSKGYKLENPAWTLDGRRILYNKIDESGVVKLFIVDLTGYNETNIIPSH